MFQRGRNRTIGGGSTLSFRRGVYKAWFRQTCLSGGGQGCRRFVNRGVGNNFGVCGGWGWCYTFLEGFCRLRNNISCHNKARPQRWFFPVSAEREEEALPGLPFRMYYIKIYIVPVLCLILLYFICHCIDCFGTEIFMSKIKSIKLLLLLFWFQLINLLFNYHYCSYCSLCISKQLFLS